jgi:3-oxoacyl-[acyl-carrier-protein] synthase I
MSGLVMGAIGCISPLGATFQFSATAWRAGISSFGNSEFFNSQLEPIKAAWVPDDALPALGDRVGFSPRQRRMLRMGANALSQTLASCPSTAAQPLPLLLCIPEPMPGKYDAFDERFLKTLTDLAQCPIELAQSRFFAVGRSAGLHALEHAFRLLEHTATEAVIIGAVDSYRDPLLISLLVQQERLLSPSNSVGFIPGEGALFMVVATQSWARQHLPVADGYIAHPGLAEEPGHIYSQAPLIGTGMTEAVKDAVAALPQGALALTHLFSSLNGEPNQAKEIGLALIRNNLSQSITKHLHPGDCFGDLGAVTSPLLMALAAKYSASPSLVVSLSDFSARSAVVVVGKAP